MQWWSSVIQIQRPRLWWDQVLLRENCAEAYDSTTESVVPCWTGFEAAGFDGHVQNETDSRESR
jgi:hypothetical protein